MSNQQAGGKKGSPFFEIKDAILIAKIFDVATRKQKPLTLWLKSQAIKFEAKLTYDERAYKTLVADYPKDFDKLKFAESLKAQGDDEILGSVILDGATTLFFKSTCQQPPESKYLYVSVPPTVFKLQRRGTLRIPFERKLAPTLSIFDPTKSIDHSKPIMKEDLLVFRMLDLSIGGCAIAAKIEDAEKLKNGLVLKDMRFLLRGMEIVGEGTIRHVLQTKNDLGKPMLRVGIQFGALKMDFETNIKQFVQDESRKLFTLL